MNIILYRWCLPICFLLCADNLDASSPRDSVISYVITDAGTEANDPSNLTSYLPDPDGKLNIAEVARSTTFSADDKKSGPEQPAAVWSRINFSNITDRDVSRVIEFTTLVRSGELYVLNGKSVVSRVKTGSDVAPRDKFILSFNNYGELLIPAGETRAVYLRTDCKKQGSSSCYRGVIGVYATGKFHQLAAIRTAWSYIYFGLMIVFGATSVFSFYLFRRAVFLSFGSLMLFFGLYFLLVHRALSPIVPGGLSPVDRYAMISIIMAIMLSLGHFVASYLRLRITMPRYYIAYRIIVAGAVLLQFPILMADPGAATVFASNAVILTWVVATIYPIIRLALRGNKAARVLGVSIFFLFLGSFLYVLGLLSFSPEGSFLLQNSFQISTLFFATIVFRELFVGFTRIKQEKEQITETEKLKSHFFANVTHEFRTPLTLMLGPLRQVIGRTEQPEDRALLRVAETNAERQLELVNQLLDLSQLDAGAMHLAASPHNFTKYLRQVVNAYASEAEYRGIDLIFTAPATPPNLYFDPEKMDKVFYNLLTNALKFTPKGGSIRVKLTQTKEAANVRVADTGQGIDADLLPRIFERFAYGGTSNTDTQGSGIGLAIVYEMVTLHGGKISVASVPNKGTTFTLSFPLGKKHLRPEEIVKSGILTQTPRVPQFSQPSDPGNTVTPPPRGSKKNLPLVLLIEDNTEMREFISQALSEKFRIITAEDGERGINLALKSPPDLIISDLMMPKKDGYTVCRDLKTDLRTSHVPIILLTARASQPARLEGLQEGADDYLTKPFDVRELVIRAGNLIRNRRHLRERFAGSITVKPSEITASSMDRDFLTAAMAHVEKYLATKELNVDHLAKSLGVSNSQLNRKLRALVDQSTNQFIQSVRLQRAAQLLSDAGTSIKEVAYSCGFSSPTYFTKVFRAEFGVTPSQFATSAAD